MKQGSKIDKAEMLMDDIRRFKETSGSPAGNDLVRFHRSFSQAFNRRPGVESLECRLSKNDPDIAPSQIYAYAALKSGVPYANGARGSFKAPMTAPGLYPEHDVFIPLTRMKNTVRWMQGEELITHLGLEYYD